MKQQLKGEETRRRPNTAASNQNSSVYKRLSGIFQLFIFDSKNKNNLKFKKKTILAHIQTTLDLPELDFSGAIRETTSRMENMMSARNNSTQNPATNHSRTSSGSNSSITGDGIQRSHTTLH